MTDAVARLPLEPGYRLSLILDPDSTIRHVIEASGVRGVAIDGLVGRTLAAFMGNRADSQAGDLWDVRLARARDADAPAHYLDREPGAPLDAPETVSSTVIPVRATGGELQAIVIEVEDRTTIGPREAQLRASERRFRELAESMPHMVWESDGAGNVSYMTPKWASFSGRPIGELLGRGYMALIHPQDRARIVAEGSSANVAGRVTTFRLRRHDGEYRWMEVQIEVLRDEHGVPFKAIGTTIDITDRRIEEEARLRSQKREMVGTLLGGIGHDFNNIISAILSNAALARREVASGHSPETSVAEIERGAARAANLVQRVLSQGRDVGAAHKVIDVAAVAREACDLLRSSIPESITLIVITDDEPASLVGDATEIHQLVLNLVTNASHALSADGGTIKVSVEGTAQACQIGSSQVVLRVGDDGPGMSDDVRQRVFDPYYTTKPAGEGSGLGLAAVQTIARAYGGQVDVDSAPGHGATFTVRLPTDRDAASTPVEPLSAAGAPREVKQSGSDDGDRSNKQDLMFVDDEPALVQLARRALPADGLHPIGFIDPQDALSAFDAEPDRWSGLVTDLSMPGFDGLTLIMRVREIRPGLPVVLTTGYLQPADLARARALGVTVIVPKPCSMSELATAVRSATNAVTLVRRRGPARDQVPDMASAASRTLKHDVHVVLVGGKCLTDLAGETHRDDAPPDVGVLVEERLKPIDLSIAPTGNG